MSKTILERYQYAQLLTQEYGTKEIVMNDAVYPTWVDGEESFLYIRNKKTGNEFRLVDANTGQP